MVKFSAAELENPAPAGASPLRLVSRDSKRPGPHQVLIDVRACGLCRTDLQLCEGDLDLHRRPVVPGHQIVGEVVAAGGEAIHPAGTRVGVTWLAGSCGNCHYCDTGLENLCHDATFTGWDVDGGFAEQVLADGRYVFPLPDSVDPVDLAPLLCGGVIGHRALRLTGLESGQRIGLYGFGASATLVLQLARHRGLKVYVATRNEADRRRAAALGAAWTGAYDARPPEPLHGAISFAPVGSVALDALRAVGRGGTVVINAIHLDRIPAFDYSLLWHERSIRSVANVTRRDAVELLDLAGAIPLGTHHQDYGLERVNQALADLAQGRVHGAAVIIPTRRS